MNAIDGITTAARQRFFAVLAGYDVVEVNLEWKPNQYTWFMSLKWGTFEVNNEQLSCSPNVLRQYKNLIPFGIAVVGVGGLDPVTQDSWQTTNQFIMLDASEVEAVEQRYA